MTGIFIGRIEQVDREQGRLFTSDGKTFHVYGSHNLVVGRYHTYSSYGGLVAASENAVTGHTALAPWCFIQQPSSMSAGLAVPPPPQDTVDDHV